MFISLDLKKNFMKEVEKSIKVYRTKLNEMNEYLKILAKKDLINLEEQSSSIDFGTIKLKQNLDRKKHLNSY